MTKDEEQSGDRTKKTDMHDSVTILAELKSAYESINRLKNTSGHRKMLLEIERKIRRERSTKEY